MSKLLHKYQNGNYTVLLYEDGTKIRFNDLDNLTPAFPESMDICITEKCDNGCAFCYAGCTEKGKHADLTQPFFDTLHAGTEIAINGNDLSHPGLEQFLEKMKSNGVIVNITVHQRHFLMFLDKLHTWTQNELIRGIGVSLSNSSDKQLYSALSMFPNAVVHTIAGFLTEDDLNNLSGHNIKLLVLGYKKVGRGVQYYASHSKEIDEKIALLSKILLSKYRNNFAVISFDNNALEQLRIKEQLPEKFWSSFYMGDEGAYTCYLDAVNQKYARSSLESETNFAIENKTVDEMFAHIRSLQ